ncbi:AsmA-like C-terminal region-containing protein [Carboxylicivirga sp. N1Y90]|uniref:AsmA-like C-terminal region-containing protein n=1 Tax=Carboxylicivirga fragile TaxID=3417571 RepID=UPI003D352EBA|nr:hypothetical protein [Marinilabiliaceae bacterium N1Y90]
MVLDQKRRKRKIIRRILGLFLALIILLITSATIYLTYNKDLIANYAVKTVNERYNVNVSYGNIEISPLVHFPDLCLSINDLLVAELDTLVPDSLKTILQLKHLYLGIDIQELFNRNIACRSLTLEEGKVNFELGENGEIKIVELFSQREDSIEVDDVLNPIDTIQKVKTAISIDIKQIEFQNIEFVYSNQIKGKSSKLHIDQLKASFESSKSKLAGELFTSLTILEAGMAGLPFKDKKIELRTNLSYANKDSLLNIDYGNIKMEQAEFSLGGLIDLKAEKYVDVNVKLKDQNMGLTSLFLSDVGVSNVNSGNIYFNAHAKGSYVDQLPNITCRYLIDDLNIGIPQSNSAIDNLTLKGSFNSGRASDFSQAVLSIDTIHGDLPNGFINGSYQIRNFKDPYLKYNLSIDTDLLGLNDVLPLGIFERLSGRIKLHDHYEGHSALKKTRQDESRTPFELTFEDVAFEIPDAVIIKSLNGKVSGLIDSLVLDDLHITNDYNDLTVNGLINGAQNFIKDEGTPLVGDFKIDGKRFDLSGALIFDPSIGQSFPYPFDSIQLHVKTTVLVDDLLNSQGVPKMGFDIYSLKARTIGFLPYAHLSNGYFLLDEIDNELDLTFDHFDINVGNSFVSADFKLKRPKNERYIYLLNMDLDRFIPKDLMVSNKSIEDSIVGVFSGSLKVEARGAYSSGQLATDINIWGDDVYMTTENDTMYTSSFTASSPEFAIASSSQDMFYRVNTSFNLSLKEILTNDYSIPELVGDFSLKNGRLGGQNVSLSNLGEVCDITFAYDMSNDQPDLYFKTEIEKMRLKKIFESVKADTILSGAVDLEVDLHCKGNSQEAMLETLNGKVFIGGEELRLNGVEVDPLIERFKRSQSFNLVDLGAVVMAGPVGLAVTKGSDYTRMLLSDNGESSRIPGFNSLWQVKDGVLIMEDVAFSSEENRIAAKGYYNLNNDELSAEIALLNQKGCSIISQAVEGTGAKPEVGQIKIIHTLLAPIRNLLEDALFKECEPFYTGKVQHPENAKH